MSTTTVSISYFSRAKFRYINMYENVRSEVHTAVLKLVVLHMTPCIFVAVYQPFGGADCSCLYIKENEGTRFSGRVSTVKLHSITSPRLLLETSRNLHPG